MIIDLIKKKIIYWPSFLKGKIKEMKSIQLTSSGAKHHLGSILH